MLLPLNKTWMRVTKPPCCCTTHEQVLDLSDARLLPPLNKTRMHYDKALLLPYNAQAGP